MTRHARFPALFATALLAACVTPLTPGQQASAQDASAAPQPTYADLADLADGTPLVLRAQVRKQAQVDAERAPGLAAGMARLYIEAQTGSLLSGTVPVGESLRYLVDVPLDSRGKVPKLKNREVILFAQPVAGQPGTIQLVDPEAQLLWSEALEARLRPVLTALAAPTAPPRVVRIRDALSVAGSLAGESETQIFLDTRNDGPVSISVLRRPGQEPVWGVSWTEIIDQAARPPQRDTLEWYRLACFLPARLDNMRDLAANAADRARAEADYAFVRDALGDCPRILGRGNPR